MVDPRMTACVLTPSAATYHRRDGRLSFLLNGNQLILYINVKESFMHQINYPHSCRPDHASEPTAGRRDQNDRGGSRHPSANRTLHTKLRLPAVASRPGRERHVSCGDPLSQQTIPEISIDIAAGVDSTLLLRNMNFHIDTMQRAISARPRKRNNAVAPPAPLSLPAVAPCKHKPSVSNAKLELDRSTIHRRR